MKISEYRIIENYMLQCMSDSAHDKEHVYRVLYVALDIAEHETGINLDVLITACLLHDIGRKEQFENPELCHAAVGSEKAFAFLIENGYDATFSKYVSDCIYTHRYRASEPPETPEAMILFDADKIDATGTLGIARTILYKGQTNEPLYSFAENGDISDGTNDKAHSFFQEYKFKLEQLYTKFYTKRGSEIALSRRDSAKSFYESMVNEVRESYNVKERLFNDLK